LAIGDIAHFRVFVPDAIKFQFREKFFRALLIEMLDAASAAGCDYLEPFRLDLQQLGHERTSAAFKVAQNPHFVRKAFFSLRSSKRLVDPTVVADANSCSEGVLDLVHAVENMAHKEVQASLEEAVRAGRYVFPGSFC
jgi:hypothetical protein